MKASLIERCRGYLLSEGSSGSGAVALGARVAVTISREAGAGAVSVAERLCEVLESSGGGTRPWCVFDRNLVERVLADHDLPDHVGGFMPEDVRSELQSALEEMLGSHPPSWTLIQHTNETICRLAAEGNVILIGRGANLAVGKAANVFHVRLVAPLDWRIQNAERYYGIDRVEAERFVRQADVGRARYVSRHFNSRIDDPLHYDVTINTARVGFDAAARMIAEGMKRG